MDHDTLRFDLVDEPIWPDDQLAQARVCWVGIGTPALTEISQGVAGSADALGEGRCEGRRVPRNVLNRLDEVSGRWFRPDYFASHLESRFLTSS
jgi:hypothetical protein